MSEPFVGEIRIFGFNYAPYGWAYCNGQTMNITQQQVLFAVIGTTYGGNGTTTFNLPNLQDSAPMHWGNGAGLTPRTIGEPLGTANVTLTAQQMPAHNHMLQAAIQANAAEQSGTPGPTAWMGESQPGNAYNLTVTTVDSTFSPKAISANGNSLPHPNVQPVLALNFCIAFTGIFPTRN